MRILVTNDDGIDSVGLHVLARAMRQFGEVVVAAVALREGVTATEDDIRAHVRQALSDYKVPERIVFLPVLPKGPTGKVQRRAIKEALSSSSHP